MLREALCLTEPLSVWPRTLSLAEANQEPRMEPCKSGLYVGRQAESMAVPSSIVLHMIQRDIEGTRVMSVEQR